MSNKTLDFLLEANEKANGTRIIIENIRCTERIPISIISITESEIFKALLNLSESLSNSYLQVKTDLEDKSRISWAGTAHEIREVITSLLRVLAPDEKVNSQNWYRQEGNTSGPTQKQRVRFILQENGASSKEKEVVESVSKMEDMIADIVRATYSRASDAAHRYKTHKEVSRIVKYFDVFACDLLDL